MAPLIKKVQKIYQEYGFAGLIQSLLFHILSRIFNIPRRRIAVFNGIAVRGTSLYSKNDIFPNHEAELISAIRKHIQNSENVIVVGGGSGASTVAVAHQVGKKGKVVAYEANRNSFLQCRETLSLNKVEEIVEIFHAIIEKPVYVLGELGNPPLIYAKDFKNSDVLVMDCEGAETPILENLKIRPRLIIVETHPLLDSPKEKVIELLQNMDYKILSSVSNNQESLDVLTAIRNL